MIHALIRVLEVVTVAQAVGDCISTIAALHQPNVVEANPLVRFAMKAVGSEWVIIRILMSLGLVYGTVNNDGWASLVVLGANVALMSYVIWSNGKLARWWS